VTREPLPREALPREALPIDAVLPAVVAHLRDRTRLVLRAAPGAGKTTRVPAALLDAGIAGSRQVVVLEPRRIAARAAAEFVARVRGGRVGGEVGYQVRFARHGDARTRLWFLTEGMLARWLADDPYLERVGAVVLDEFHERHLAGDVALAVVAELQATVRPDLRLAVMSATLDTEALARHLGPDTAMVTSEGRAHPVELVWDESSAPVLERAAGAVGRELARPGGDLLVFLPGAGEIARTASLLAATASRHATDVVPLHGDLPLDRQRLALERGPRRRVVLATNVAETALTVDGVDTVVDTGLARAARFDARRGIDRLVLGPISRASAEQRAGRAGRLGPGRCIRLWSRAEHGGRRAHETPEILRLDFSRTLLELRAWGQHDVAGFGWLDPPPAATLAAAERLLVRLGALDAGDGSVMPLGRRLLAEPLPPRLGRVLVEAEERGCPQSGALLVALAAERDVMLGRRALAGTTADWPPGPSDLLLRMALFEDAARAGFDHATCRRLGLEPRAVHAVERVRRQLGRRLGADAPPASARATPGFSPDDERLLRCVLAGFPDRVARRREPGSPRAVMVGGSGVTLAAESVVRDAELFVAFDVGGGGSQRADWLVRLASAVHESWLVPELVRDEHTLVFDEARGTVVERRRRLYDDLALAESVRTDVDRGAAGELLADLVRADPRRVVAADGTTAELLARLRFLARAMPELALPDDPWTLAGEAAAILASGRRSLADVRTADVTGAVRGLLTNAQRAALERDAPERLALPSGREARIAYEPDAPPAVEARIQEVFGLASTPRLAAGRVPLVVRLLAPNGRPAQITDDLASFWRTTYASVRRELRGRYPQHDWPEDPSTATPSRGPRRRR
jgi:ATP-dependent helicase HrpB